MSPLARSHNIYPTPSLITSRSDPFVAMQENNKVYGFTIAVKELRETVPNIFRYAAAYKRSLGLDSRGLWEFFLEKKPEEKAELPKDDPNYKKPLPEEVSKNEPGAGKLPEISLEDMEGENYNMCHFWSNFEIARLDWFRSKEYEDFFQTMDRSGGFWMERVSVVIQTFKRTLLTFHSGETHQSTLWLRAFCSIRPKSTTSATLATVTRP